MTQSTTQKRATYADLEALPDHVVGELIDGELFASPRPATAHAHCAFELARSLPRDGGGGGGAVGWSFLLEPELHFDEGRRVLVPDVAGWRSDRLTMIPSAAFLTVAPNWVCEILSPSTVRLDRIRKLPIYASVAVEHLWLIDPVAELVEVFRAEHGRWFLLGTHGGDAVARLEPFGDVEMNLQRLWLRPPKG